MSAIRCPYCGDKAYIRGGIEIYPHRPDLRDKRLWACMPCGAWVGTHKNSKNVPLGRLANAELRKLKMRAHVAFDPMWKTNGMKRGQAYKWLEKKTGILKPHIGEMDEDQCRLVIEVCNETRINVNEARTKTQI